MESIQDRIKAIRDENNLTQEEFGKIIGRSRQQVADIIRGKSSVSCEDIQLICNHFNISADYLLGLSEVKTQDKDIQCACDYTGLSEQAVEILKKGTETNKCFNDFVDLFLTKVSTKYYYEHNICTALRLAQQNENVIFQGLSDLFKAIKTNNINLNKRFDIEDFINSSYITHRNLEDKILAYKYNFNKQMNALIDEYAFMDTDTDNDKFEKIKEEVLKNPIMIEVLRKFYKNLTESGEIND